MKHLFKDKRGSSLVLVMICMSFLILLAGAVITTTITNIRLKSSQKVTQENFYETDTILDAISAGIQNESSEASAKAYEQALGEYNASLTAAGDSMNDKYSMDYLNRMLQKLTGESYDATKITYKYKDSVLKGYLNDEQVGCYIDHADTDSHGNTVGTMEVDGDALVLKDVSVKKEHDVQKNYETTLTTDIRIEVPKVNTDAHSEYLDYAVLADDQIKADNGTVSADIKGNVYSGTVNRTDSEDTKAGIVISGGASLKINAEQIITRGDVSVSNSSRFEIGKSASSEKNAELWAENVITSGKGTNGGNQVKINASSYVADDMEIGGSNDTVELAGKYYGYNFTDNYSIVPTLAPAATADPNAHVKLSTQASYSSSISVNGYDDRLVMKDLSELVLAGRTFISKKANVGETAPGGATLSNPDIELGESLAVKSGQLSYFVGAVKSGSIDGFVKKVDDMPVGTTHITAVPGEGTFDLDANEGKECYYFDVKGETYLFDYVSYENRIGIPKDSNGNKQFSVKEYIQKGYLDAAAPLKLYSRYDATVSSDPIQYFYLNFVDSKQASKFFNLFYNQSSQQTVYDVVNKTYVDAIGIQIPSFASKSGYLLSSGNIMYSDENDKDANGKAKIKLKLENSSQNPTTSFLKFAEDNSKIYMSKQLGLVDDYEVATNSSNWRLYDDNDANRPDDNLTKSGKSDNTNLFAALVSDTSKITGTYVGNYPVTRDDGSTINCGYIVSNSNVKWPEDYTAKGYSAMNPCFILTTKSVTVNGDFNGLILAGDDVEMNAVGLKINADSEAVEKLFDADKKAASPVFYNLMSKYFRKSVDATIGSDEESADIDNVTYENWKKND